MPKIVTSMKNRLWAPLITLCLLASAALPAQEEAQDATELAVNAPYVSHVQVGINGAKVILAWEPSADAPGKVDIYRFSEEITAVNFAQAAKIGSCDQELGRFEDHPPLNADSFYAILVTKNDGSDYAVFIPFKNATAIAVRIKSEIHSDEKLVLTAENVKDYIHLQISSSKSDQKLLVYRSTDRINSARDILNATLIFVGEKAERDFSDYPIPGINYYYTLLSEEALKTGGLRIVPGENSTERPLMVPAGRFRVGLPSFAPNSRSMPLPALSVRNANDIFTSNDPSSITYPDPVKVKTETQKAIDGIASLLPSKQAEAEPDFTVLDKEHGRPETGEEYTLAEIVGSAAKYHNWPDAVFSLENFLSLYRSEAVEARARFYLGQAYFFSKQYREALFNLLLVQESLYTESSDLINLSLDRLHKSKVLGNSANS
jgi:hypothetical protein